MRRTQIHSIETVTCVCAYKIDSEQILLHFFLIITEANQLLSLPIIVTVIVMLQGEYTSFLP